jgi:UDP-glucose 4-epimerase
VIIASTSEVYGKGTQIPFREDGDLLFGATNKGRWSYACSKAIDEFLALAYWKEKRLPVIIARLFNTVGPRQSSYYGMVLPNFVKQATMNIPLTIYGNGQQTRCFTHVRDTVTALIALSFEPDAIGEVFNVGSEEEISITALAELVKEMTGSSSPLQYIPYDVAYEHGFEDMLRRKPNLTKIKNLIGYQPTTSLRDIILDMIQFNQYNFTPTLEEKIKENVSLN